MVLICEKTYTRHVNLRHEKLNRKRESKQTVNYSDVWPVTCRLCDGVSLNLNLPSGKQVDTFSIAPICVDILFTPPYLILYTFPPYFNVSSPLFLLPLQLIA